jgi:hypothetical protein
VGGVVDISYTQIDAVEGETAAQAEALDPLPNDNQLGGGAKAFSSWVWSGDPLIGPGMETRTIGVIAGEISFWLYLVNVVCTVFCMWAASILACK